MNIERGGAVAPAAALSDRKVATHICVLLHPAPTTTPAGAVVGGAGVVGWAGNNSTRQATINNDVIIAEHLKRNSTESEV